MMLIAALILFRPAILTGEEWCPLIVKVYQQDSSYQAEADITVTEEDGARYSFQNAPGEAKFCGLGFRPVTVEVKGFCETVRVATSWFVRDETRILKVLLDQERCFRDRPHPPIPVCDILLRIRDESGAPRSDATFVALAPKEWRRQSDSYGRVSTVIAMGEELRGYVSARKSVDLPLRIPCRRGQAPTEKVLVLRGPQRSRE